VHCKWPEHRSRESIGRERRKICPTRETMRRKGAILEGYHSEMALKMGPTIRVSIQTRLEFDENRESARFTAPRSYRISARVRVVGGIPEISRARFLSRFLLPPSPSIPSLAGKESPHVRGPPRAARIRSMIFSAQWANRRKSRSDEPRRIMPPGSLHARPFPRARLTRVRSPCSSGSTTGGREGHNTSELMHRTTVPGTRRKSIRWGH